METMKVCCIEFSNILVDQKRNVLDVMNRELFYSFKAKDGYKKTKHFTEFPQWINHIKGMVDPNNVDIHICTNVFDTIAYLENNTFDYVLFSNILSTSEYIEFIINRVVHTSIKFVIGTGIGSVKLNLKADNIFQHDTLGEFSKIHNLNKEYSLKYIDQSIHYNPRIYTTYGCKNHCKFCKNDGNFGMLSSKTYINYANIRDSNSLVYVGNKTFLQGGVDEIHSLRNISKDNTFIVQSCVNTLRDNIQLFDKMYSVGVRIVEIGIESFSKDTLKRLGKNNDLHSIPTIVNALNSVGIKVIFNIMVGIKDDTQDDYEATIFGIKTHMAKLYALNITYYSDYDSNIKDDRDERILIKSWIKDDMIQATKTFAEQLYTINYKLITETYNDNCT